MCNLSDALLANLAGWDAVKQARGLVAAERVLASDWQPPKLQGTVREGSTTYRAGLIIRSASDADNLFASCRTHRANAGVDLRPLDCHRVPLSGKAKSPEILPRPANHPPVTSVKRSNRVDLV